MGDLYSLLSEESISLDPQSWKDTRIKTGYFRVPAVCFTEVPLIHSEEIRKVFGDYGIAFRKSEIIRHGGNPALYMTDSKLQAQQSRGGFCAEIKPFVNVVRISSTAPANKAKLWVYYLHEREWRIAHDVDLKAIVPFGLIFPDGSARTKFQGQHGTELLGFASRFGEITYS